MRRSCAMVRGLATGLLVVLLAAAGLASCGEEVFVLETGMYSKTTLSVTADACHLSRPVGDVDNGYGKLTVSDTQVTHTTTFNNEIFMRSGNGLSRTLMTDMVATGDCLLNVNIQDAGSVTAKDTVEMTHTESHTYKSGNCTGVVGINCLSSFKFRLNRLGP